MRAHRDPLDGAIDQVAQRLTRVDEDAQFASRIIAALPERMTWFGWLTHAWAPRLAMMAIVAGTLVFWSTRHTTDVTPAAQPLASVANTNWPQLASAARRREPLAANSSKPLEAVAPMEPVEPFGGLPSLALADVAPAPLHVEDVLAVPALELVELPLTAESFPERK